MVSTRTLDHIVHLVEPAQLQSAITAFEKLGFTVVNGGTHADGLTYNALIVFSDGVYIELIAFTRPLETYPPGTPERKQRESHRWSPAIPGWIDYANLGLAPDVSVIINERAGEALYLPTVSGGRVRPDGQTLKWRINAPSTKFYKTGMVPFFCGDVTPRSLRVPLEEDNTSHPNKATGIAHIRLLCASSVRDSLEQHIISVLGVAPLARGSNSTEWPLQTPDSGREGSGPRFVISIPSTDEEHEFLKSRAPDAISPYEIALYTTGGDKRTEHTPQGRLVFVPASA